jgi:Phosphotransferase enzyme family
MGRGRYRSTHAARRAAAAVAFSSKRGAGPSLDSECTWLLANGVLPADLVLHNREIARAALRPSAQVFTHGDLQLDHVFVEGDEITGVLDWSEAGQGDAMYDLAILTLGHPEQLGDVIVGYGAGVDRDVIRAYWSLRSLTAIRWLVPTAPRSCRRNALASQRGSWTVREVGRLPRCASLRNNRRHDRLDRRHSRADDGRTRHRSGHSVGSPGSVGTAAVLVAAGHLDCDAST